MKAEQAKVEAFLSRNKTQFVIPVYQRNYDWKNSQCKQFLDDILKVGTNEDENAHHFIGSIVCVGDGLATSSGGSELTVIDGQQRLTTLTLIYIVLHRLASEMNNKNLVDEIHETYLINKFMHGEEEEKLKLRPTENNHEAIKYLLKNDNNKEFASPFSNVINNFDYFKNRIIEENYKSVLTGLSRLMFVEIILEKGKDDPQRIYESLNSTGLELSQADLIRNYILMNLEYEEQKEIYDDYWTTIEELAKDETENTSKVSDFIRDYLTLKNNRIPNQQKVYLEFKIKFPTTDLENLKSCLSPITSLVHFYNKLLNPKNEEDKEIRTQLEYIKRLQINVAYSFLMQVYEDYSIHVINQKTFIEILDFIQSFICRRFIVGLPTNALNKIFMNLYQEVEKDNYLLSLQKFLLKKQGRQRFPRDKEVIESLKIKDVYNMKHKNKTYLLERLENFENREYINIEKNTDITIEHIFPQNPDPKWKRDLGTDEYNLIKETYLHTISNLTLSGNNGKLGNKPFEDKRDLDQAGYKDSRLWLNKYLSEAKKWDKTEIEGRFKLLSERFLKIWKYPNIEIEDKDENNEVNIFEAEEPTGKKLEYAIFFDEKLEITQVAKLYVEVFKQLFDLQPETFFTTELAKQITLTKKSKEGNLRQEVQINDSYFIEGNIDNMGKFERIKDALTIFELEDELIIKYAEN